MVSIFYQRILENDGIFFLKKYRHLKSKILISSIGYYFVLFILLAFLTSFFPISPIQTCQKILKIFVVLLLYGL